MRLIAGKYGMRVTREVGIEISTDDDIINLMAEQR